MHKLLKEPIIDIKGLNKPIKYKKNRIVKKTDRSKPINWRLIHESDKKETEALLKLWSEDKYRARITFFNNGAERYSFHRLVLFEWDDEFEICLFKTKIGITKNNKLYSRQTKIISIKYKSGKFWFIRKVPQVSLRKLNIVTLCNFIGEVESKYGANILNSEVFKYLEVKFPFIRVLWESKLSHIVSFEKIYKSGLTSLYDIERYLTGLPKNVLKIIKYEQFTNNGVMHKRGYLSKLKDDLSVIESPENLRFDMLNCYYFSDTIRFAKILGRKINARWGLKRFISMHDKWSNEITNVLLENEVERELNINKVFKEFAKSSGFELLKTNKDMLREGYKQKHCVGTYIEQVESGRTAIFNIDGYTLQLIIKEEIRDSKRYRILKNNQFRGKYNKDAPEELYELVKLKLDKFNEEYQEMIIEMSKDETEDKELIDLF